MVVTVAVAKLQWAVTGPRPRAPRRPWARTARPGRGLGTLWPGSLAAGAEKPARASESDPAPRPHGKPPPPNTGTLPDGARVRVHPILQARGPDGAGLSARLGRGAQGRAGGRESARPHVKGRPGRPGARRHRPVAARARGRDKDRGPGPGDAAGASGPDRAGPGPGPRTHPAPAPGGWQASRGPEKPVGRPRKVGTSRPAETAAHTFRPRAGRAPTGRRSISDGPAVDPGRDPRRPGPAPPRLGLPRRRVSARVRFF